MIPTYTANGIHALLDGDGVSPLLLNDGKTIAKYLAAAATKAGATVLSTHIEHFEPQGVSVACVLAESHITIHTYPENGSFMADIFTCGEQCDPQVGAIYLAARLGCISYALQVIHRGQ